MKKLPLILSFIAMISLGGCKHEETNTIYTSFYPLYDFTKRIVQDKMEVVNLTPYGSEPHDYELTAKKVASLYDGKALFINGLGIENWATSLPSSLAKKTYTLSEGIQTLTLENTADPHLWLSPSKAILEMSNIVSALKEIDPDNYSYYQSNFLAAKLEFEAFDAKWKERSQNFKNKYLLVSHAAFGYLCQDYGLNQIYVSGLSPDSEPTSKALENILDDVKNYNISTIFYEELVSPDISELIATKTGIQTATLNPLEGISEEEIQEGKDYLSLMDDNLTKIERALNV